LAHYEAAENIDISVVTDGSRILGLGDLGIGGIGIPIGKLSLYIACAGISPDRTLPVVLDLGTNNKTLLEDPLYLGLKQPRLSSQETCEFVAEFVQAYHAYFKKAILQFEDFSNDTCFDILAQNRHKYPVFNDDIRAFNPYIVILPDVATEGTAAVALAGLIRALILTKSSMKESRVVFFGAGSAAVGIAEMMRDYAMLEEGLSKEEATNLFWLVDSKVRRLHSHQAYLTPDEGPRRGQPR
jgi:malate dehydrogenase (oxaloacetate-decarboxylating)(NADP+)